MIDRIPDEPMSEDSAESCDLAERLARYRSRVAREGRRAALERLDRAIDEARARPKKAG
jgi:hypothetical protein